MKNSDYFLSSLYDFFNEGIIFSKIFQNQCSSSTSGSSSSGNSSVSSSGGASQVDTTGILGNNVDKYYIGASPDAMAEYRQADQDADQNIQNVLSSDTQKSKYDQSKGQWWKNVKDAVFSSLSSDSK